MPFGKITLNRNVTNYFTEVEQAAFSPANIVPGWDITADPSKSCLSSASWKERGGKKRSAHIIHQLVLQVRLFAYGDTQRYRLGINFQQLPTNRSFYTYNPTRRDGSANVLNYGDIPNYIPSIEAPPVVTPSQYEQPANHEEWIGHVTSFQYHVTDEDFVQPREVWHALGQQKDQQAHLVYNVACMLYMAIKPVRLTTYGQHSRSSFYQYVLICQRI